MSGAITPTVYMQKAERALASAKLLLASKDTEGACNRAYYAMFDAAYAALTAVGVKTLETYRSHKGLISAFGQHVVQAHGVDASFGRSINQVQHQRQLADYTGDPISHEDAAWAVEQAAAFIAAMRMKFK